MKFFHSNTHICNANYETHSSWIVCGENAWVYHCDLAPCLQNWIEFQFLKKNLILVFPNEQKHKDKHFNIRIFSRPVSFHYEPYGIHVIYHKNLRIARIDELAEGFLNNANISIRLIVSLWLWFWHDNHPLHLIRIFTHPNLIAFHWLCKTKTDDIRLPWIPKQISKWKNFSGVNLIEKRWRNSSRLNGAQTVG